MGCPGGDGSDPDTWILVYNRRFRFISPDRPSKARSESYSRFPWRWLWQTIRTAEGCDLEHHLWCLGVHSAKCLSLSLHRNRISTPPSGISLNPFPAALIDAVAGYNYLVGNIGFSPDDIIVLGDSSGGNLALALARHLIESRRMVEDVTIPLPPGGLILCSPWVNLGPPQQTPPPLHTSTLLRTSSTLLLPRHINWSSIMWDRLAPSQLYPTLTYPQPRRPRHCRPSPSRISPAPWKLCAMTVACYGTRW